MSYKNMTSKKVKGLFDSLWKDNLSESKRFHYAWRMRLWTGKKRYKRELKSLQSWFFAQHEQKEEHAEKRKKKWFMASLREKYASIYPDLGKYTALLFRYRYAKQYYQADLWKELQTKVAVKTLVDLAEKLLNDPDAMCVLGTHAVNYLFALNYYLQQIGDKKSLQWMHVRLCVILGRYKKLPHSYALLEIYYITHMIIGATDFYWHDISQKEKRLYFPLLKRVESLIQNNYFTTKLDVKLEFLVCCRILAYVSPLFALITQEAWVSVHEEGYIVDMYNTYATVSPKSLELSEHRNVLYIMSATDPVFQR